MDKYLSNTQVIYTYWLTHGHFLYLQSFVNCICHYNFGSKSLHSRIYQDPYTAQRAPRHMSIDLFVIAQQAECCPHSKNILYQHWIGCVKTKTSRSSTPHSPLTHVHSQVFSDLRTDMLILLLIFCEFWLLWPYYKSPVNQNSSVQLGKVVQR